ncbi:MAG TPA: alanyl-tRNA editing protein [Gemmatimonadales bacterium]|nr:alanyl-tRNA editing protein [Gemmatimonadales bacterium]
MTERLYYTDAYLARFDAAVLERGDGGRRIYLDRTAFYPTSGGQPFDAGRLGESSIVNVIDEGERIAHLLDAPLDPAAARVEGVVEWARRFDHMQQHTGQHLLSAVLAELFGWATESVHFGAETSTLDLDAGAVSPEQMRAAETRANEIVWEDRPVTVSFEDAESAGGLRKASDRSGTLRIVSIGELDRSACGGTHVRATGAIGAILIRGTERVRKQARVEFVCGGRALRDAWRNRALVQSLAAAYSAAPADLPALVEAQRAELKGAEAARRALEQELDAHRARALHAATPADAAGLRRALVRDVEGGIERLRGLAQAYAAEPRSVLVGALAAPPALLVATSADSGIDAGARLQAVLGQVGGRGGGNARLAQGTVPDAAALARAVELLA